MKKTNKKFILLLSFISILVFNSCDPFDDVYLTLSMDTEFNAAGIGPNISVTNNFCLSQFDDYNNNKDNLEEIKYITSAYFTIYATQGLHGNNLTITLYQADGSTELLKFIVPTFIASDYVDKPLKINLTDQEIHNLNAYLLNPKNDKCFVAKFEVSNVQPTITPYQLNSKVEFLAELKVKP